MACITGETIATTSICITQPIARTITRAWWCCLCFGDQRFVYTQQQQQQQQRRRVERPRIIHTHSNYVYLDVLMACFLGIKCNYEGVRRLYSEFINKAIQSYACRSVFWFGCSCIWFQKLAPDWLKFFRPLWILSVQRFQFKSVACCTFFRWRIHCGNKLNVKPVVQKQNGLVVVALNTYHHVEKK